MGSRRRGAAFSLIEMIAVLALIAILAGIALSLTVRQLDRLASDQEYARLRTIAQAFKDSVLRHRYIPGATGASNWVDMVAMEMGADSGMVSTNARRLPRTFLIDPEFQVGANGFGLPYHQTVTGSVVTNASGDVILPVNPRLLLLSSMGPPLPVAITNGGLTTNAFSAIWEAADGSRPPGSVWDAWSGTGDDLKVQRINLAPLFARLFLTTLYSGTNRGRYAIDSSVTTPVPDESVNAVFLTGSLLSLFSQDGTSDCKQIISRDSHFVYSLGIWRGSIYDGPSLPTPLLATMAGQFINSPNNPNAGNVDMAYNYGTNPPSMLATKQMWLDHYKQYMQLYIDWANANFPDDASYKDPLKQMAADMEKIGAALYKDIAEGQCY